MKVLGMVNKYNRGIAKVNRELETNGNPLAQFDYNKLTEFRVTIIAKPESGPIKPESGPIKPESGPIKPESGPINSESGPIKPESGPINSESGPINSESGPIKRTIAQTYDTESQDEAVVAIISANPGIKREEIFLRVQTSIKSVQRTLNRLSAVNKIEYRGSKRTGGWFIKT